jgi:hypothetical protein
MISFCSRLHAFGVYFSIKYFEQIFNLKKNIKNKMKNNNEICEYFFVYSKYFMEIFGGKDGKEDVHSNSLLANPTCSVIFSNF